MIQRSLIFGICISLVFSIFHCLEPPNQLRLADKKCTTYSAFANSNAIPDSLTKGELLDGGGQRVLPKEFPHMVRIGYGPLNEISWICGGSIISPRYILTTASCTKTVHGEPTFVTIGDLIFDDETDDAQPETIKISEIIVHPNYTFNVDYNDIALLQLPNDIEFNSYVRPACLNTESIIPETKAIVTGWKYTQLDGPRDRGLVKMTLNLDSHEDCTKVYSPDKHLPNGIINDQHICAGSKGRNNYCIGETGNPLQVQHEKHSGMFKIIGIASNGLGCGIDGKPDYYTRVSKYIDWIEEKVFSNQ